MGKGFYSKRLSQNKLILESKAGENDLTIISFKAMKFWKQMTYYGWCATRSYLNGL